MSSEQRDATNRGLLYRNVSLEGQTTMKHLSRDLRILLAHLAKRADENN
jgi:hypothetical protein